MSFSIKTGAQAVATSARAVAKGTGVLLDFLDNASVKLRPLSHIPLIGDTIGDVQDLISMLHDYYHGEYKKVPAVVMTRNGCDSCVSCKSRSTLSRIIFRF